MPGLRVRCQRLVAQQLVDVQAEAADAFQHGRPFLAQEALAFACQQFFAGAFSDIHADPPSFFY
jgi:hypothetical protein